MLVSLVFDLSQAIYQCLLSNGNTITSYRSPFKKDMPGRLGGSVS